MSFIENNMLYKITDEIIIDLNDINYIIEKNSKSDYGETTLKMTQTLLIGFKNGKEISIYDFTIKEFEKKINFYLAYTRKYKEK